MSEGCSGRRVGRRDTCTAQSMLQEGSVLSQPVMTGVTGLGLGVRVWGLPQV
jgi:hypothetical protein